MCQQFYNKKIILLAHKILYLLETWYLSYFTYGAKVSPLSL